VLRVFALTVALAWRITVDTNQVLSQEPTPVADAAVIKNVQVANGGVVSQPPASEIPMPGAADGSTPATGAPASGTNPGAPTVSAETVKRPTAEKYVPLPIDKEIRSNPDGKVGFNIVGQPWETVLHWLADASALSLDWQELPGDSLNLITTRDYSMIEARDLINRHLLTRGFTMIINGEVMSIVRTKDLNPAIVERVKPEELDSLPDHTICKVSFDLDWLIAGEAVDELKPMLSSAGQIHKLSRTNRLEVIDTAVSLRHIWHLLQDEQSESGDEQLVRVFRLKERRAEDVIRILRELLKLQEPSGGMQNGGQGLDPGMVMQMMQQMQQTMQQAAQQPGAGGGAKPPVETRLVLNQRENMIIAQAAPDQMALIEKAIKEIDVPGDPDRSVLQNINRMKIYRLESVDPQTLTDLLQQIGDMDPGTVIRVDKQKRSIIAWATLADHLTISTLVEKLDQSSRRFEVIPLRRLDAEYVAGTIRALMDKEEKAEDNDPFRPRYYGFFDYGAQQQTPKEPAFRIEADIEHNRLLINANPLELEEIRNLLVKLGELPDPNASDAGMRVFDVSPDENLQELQDRLRHYWRRGNPLQFELPKRNPNADPPAEEPAGEPDRDQKSGQDVTTGPGASQQEPASTLSTRTPVEATAEQAFDALLESAVPGRSGRDTASVPVMTKFVQDEDAEVKPPTGASDGSRSTSQPKDPVIDRAVIERLKQKLRDLQAAEDALTEIPSVSDLNEGRKSPNRSETEHTGETRGAENDRPSAWPSEVAEPDIPIVISMSPDGRLVASSSDPQALADFEELLGQVAAPRRGYKLYRLKYATPSWVTLNLKDFFKSEEQTKNSYEYDPYYGFVRSQGKTRGSNSLSRRRQPQFISDNFTSTILVRDADAKQLETIEDLIGIYDVPEPADTRSMRVTTIFRLKHARAASVAAAVKDVFRDLLSSNDKALETDDKSQRSSSGGLVTFLPSSRGSSGSSSEDEEEPIRFKGLLSIGIDESSNTLIVSSAGTLMDTIAEMIESLDLAANTASVVQVMKVDKSVDIGQIQQRLRELMQSRNAQAQQQPGQQPSQQPGQPQPGQPGSPQAEAAAAGAIISQ
jgi:type II secretory pathway component GspD/PulD (secretin)